MALISSAAAIAVVWRDGWQRAAEILSDDLGLLASVAPKVAAAVLLAVLLGRLIPKAKVARSLGEESGLRGLLLATLLGMLVPGGPFTAFPLAFTMARGGGDPGAVCAFLSSWMLLALNRTLIWEIAFFEPSFVAARFLLCLPVPPLLGLAARRLGRPRLPDSPPAGRRS